MFTKLTLTAVSLAVVCSPLSAQSNPTKDELVLKRFLTDGSSIDSMSEYGYEIATRMKENSKLNLVIKLCTSESLAVAAGKAAVDPIGLAWFLQNSRVFPPVPVERMLVETSQNCLKNTPERTAVEIWLIPDSNSPNETRITACRLSSTEYRSKSDENDISFVGTNRPRRAFDMLGRDIENGIQDAGVVIAYRNLRSSRKLNRSWGAIKRYVRSKNLDASKLFFGKLPWNSGDGVGLIQKIVVKGIKVENNCSKGVQKPREILID